MKILPHATPDYVMTTSFYYADLDDNSVELQHDNFGDWKRSKEFKYSSSEFAADPIGKPLDPEKMIEARSEEDQKITDHPVPDFYRGRSKANGILLRLDWSADSLSGWPDPSPAETEARA